MKNNYILKRISDIKLSFIILVLFGIMPVIGVAQTLTFSSNNPSIPAKNLALASIKKPIYRAVFVGSGANGAGGNLSKVTFTPRGTFISSDITKYQFWYNTIDDLSTASNANSNDQTNILANGNSVTITQNNIWFAGTYYFWITADISPTAIESHTLTVDALTTNNFSFDRGTKTGTMSIGGTQTIGTKAIYNSNGSYTFTVPPGVYSINVEVWGAGAGGNNNTNKGGGGGAYAGNPAISVTPGTSCTVTVGKGGTAGNDGTFSSFNSTILVKAAGATGANGGSTSNSTGTILYAGGNGGTSSDNGGAGGGGSGGAGGAGSNGSGSTTNTGGAGGAAGIAGSGSAGATGGNGGSFASRTWYSGNSGNSPGAGGGENSESGSGSGAGADGQVIISWATPASMWYKADVGTGTTTNGTGITTWADQSGSSNNATSQTTTAPTFQALGWNFNPSVSFSTGYFLTKDNDIFNDMTFFTVYNTGATGGGAVYNCPAIIGGEVANVQDDYYLSLKDGKPLFKAKDQDDDGAISTIVTSDNSPRILSATHKKVLNGHNLLYINGNLEADQNMADRGNATLSKPTQLGIGNHFNPLSGSQFNGNISEVIGSASVFTTSDRQNFESYLAIKYGITLAHDYTNSSSTSIYPISGYSNDIAGLGRNDIWQLHQKVSASSNMASGNSRVVMATSNDFVSSNVNTPSRTALTNGQYLIWGHNNGSTSTWTEIGSIPTDSIVSRAWKVVNTGCVNPVYFQIDLSGYTSENGIYRLLVADNSNFTGATYYYLTKTSGNLYTVTATANAATPSTVSFPGVRYFTIAQKSNYWKGTSTSSDWGTDANWTAGEVPPTGAKVEYATAKKCGVEAANNLVLNFPERTASNVINATTWNLTIPAGNALTVNNNIITDKNPDRILIKTRTGTDTPEVPNGTLIYHNSAANPVFGTVEMYSKAKMNPNPDPNNQNIFVWQYFGIPVETIKPDPTLYGAYVRKSIESGTDNDTDTNDEYLWKEMGNNDDLTAFDGYEICQPSPTTYTFSGKLVNWDKLSGQLACTTDAAYPGQHLFANPYTAAIDIKKLVFEPDMEWSVFLYHTGSYKNWSEIGGAGSNGENPGQYISVPQNRAGDLGIPAEVPSMKSMLIKTSPNVSTAHSYLNIIYKDVVKKNETMQRVKKADGVTNADVISTKIDLTGEHYSDRMWIFTDPTCTRNYDNGWDGRKMLGSSLAPQIYAVEPDGDYQVNSVNDMHDTDIAFQPGNEVEYTLKFTHENIQRQYAGVYLVDQVENKTIDVTQNESTYKFATAQSDVPTKRFKIITRYYEKNAPDAKSQLKIFSAKSTVYIQNLGELNGDCILHNIAGQAVRSLSFGPGSITTVSNLRQGAYVISATTNGEKVSKRVIVQ